MNMNQKAIRDLTIILIVKVLILLSIKHIWFDAPTIPKNFDQTVAARIAGNTAASKQETRE